MTITQAEKMHAVAIAKLIMQAMNYDCCQYFAGPEHTLQDFENMMIRLVEADNSQYSYRNSIVALADDGNVDIDMTFTAPSCPAADFILEDVRQKVDSLDGVKSSNVNLVFEPVWDQSMMTEEARVELGFD